MRIDETVAGRSIRVVVVTKGSKIVGKIFGYFGKGKVTVNVWNWENNESGYYEGSASGYGYDRFTAALKNSGATFGGVPFYNHGDSISDRDLETIRRAQLGETATFEAVRKRMRKKCISVGRTDCYVLAGLDGLEARGYGVRTVL